MKARSLKKGYEKVTPNLMYILGVLKGDGSICKMHFQLGSIDKEFVINFNNKVFKWCGIKKQIIYYKDEWTVQVWSVNAVNFLRTLNINNILNLSKKHKIEFLKGLFDSEGSMSKDGRVDFDNCNKGIIDIVSILLRELNIIHSVRILIKAGTKTNYGIYKNHLYQIHIFRSSLSQFSKYIGFIIIRKNKILNEEVNKITSNNGILVN